ncbi:uncharacterized protein A4U43_C05F14450 [Asparagus officinalis]|uniref:Uncharacterized protein n=1 Tax=Asparagus officinalis TaxID=4686 RepID=A0A5P1ES80_ASPOF|nr:uncharacterized protein A4U43_C05F14450 [Asparagus officinalis]
MRLWQVVNKYIDEEIAELVLGVLFIDEVQFSYDVPIAFVLERSSINNYIFTSAGSYAGHGMLFLPKSCYGELDITYSNICYKQRNMQYIDKLVIYEESLAYVVEIGQQASLRSLNRFSFVRFVFQLKAVGCGEVVNLENGLNSMFYS